MIEEKSQSEKQIEKNIELAKKDRLLWLYIKFEEFLFYSKIFMWWVIIIGGTMYGISLYFETTYGIVGGVIVVLISLGFYWVLLKPPSDMFIEMKIGDPEVGESDTLGVLEMPHDLLKKYKWVGGQAIIIKACKNKNKDLVKEIGIMYNGEEKKIYKAKDAEKRRGKYKMRNCYIVEEIDHELRTISGNHFLEMSGYYCTMYKMGFVALAERVIPLYKEVAKLKMLKDAHITQHTIEQMDKFKEGVKGLKIDFDEIEVNAQVQPKDA